MSILNFRLNKPPFALESNQGDENDVIGDYLCRADQLGYHLMLLREKKELHLLPQALFKSSLSASKIQIGEYLNLSLK